MPLFWCFFSISIWFIYISREWEQLTIEIFLFLYILGYIFSLFYHPHLFKEFKNIKYIIAFPFKINKKEPKQLTKVKNIYDKCFFFNNFCNTVNICICWFLIGPRSRSNLLKYLPQFIINCNLRQTKIENQAERKKK